MNSAFWNDFRRGLPTLLYRQARWVGIVWMAIAAVVLQGLAGLWLIVAMLWILSKLLHSGHLPPFLSSWWVSVLVVSFFLIAVLWLGLMCAWMLRQGVMPESDAFNEAVRQSLFGRFLVERDGDSFWITIRQDWLSSLSRWAPGTISTFTVFAAFSLLLLTVFWVIAAVEWLLAPFSSSGWISALGVAFFLVCFGLGVCFFIFRAATLGRETQRKKGTT